MGRIDGTVQLTCPYDDCGRETDAPDLRRGQAAQVDCDHCERPISISVEQDEDGHWDRYVAAN